MLIDVREESAKVKFKNITTNHRQQVIMLLMKKLIKKVKPSYTEEIEEKEEITEDNKISVKKMKIIIYNYYDISKIILSMKIT